MTLVYTDSFPTKRTEPRVRMMPTLRFSSVRPLLSCRRRRLYTSSLSSLLPDDMSAKKILFVLGGPGAGKGTQCAKLVDKYGFVHLSAGDLLREERQSGSENGDLIDRMIKEGQIVPVKITLGLLQQAMIKSGKDLFLIDGFPRNFDNLQGWQEEMPADVFKVEGVLFFDCPESVMEERLLERGKTSGRTDDNAEAIRKRFHTYIESTMPVIDYYAKQDKVFKVDATPGPDAVFEAARQFIEPIVGAQ